MAFGFDKLRVWRDASDLLVEIYKITATFPKHEMFALTDQLRRSANSVCANIAEATGRYYYKDKVKVLYIARGEIEETKSHLLNAMKLSYIKGSGVNGIIEKYSDLHKKLNNFISSLVDRSS